MPEGPEVPDLRPVAVDEPERVLPGLPGGPPPRDLPPGGWSLEDADWAAATALEEAPPEGRLAVLWVIRRRMRACACRARDVVQAPLQFQPWRQGGKVRRMLRRIARPDREAMETAVLAARVLAGRVPDPTGGATHFHAAEYPAGVPYLPDWADELERTSAAGGNVYYRRPRAAN